MSTRWRWHSSTRYAAFGNNGGNNDDIVGGDDDGEGDDDGANGGDGLLERPGRGLYIAADSEPTENVTLAKACQRVPQGVVCLLSVLRFHDLTTQAPFEVWIAISRKAWLPKVDYPPLRVVRFSGQALTFGVVVHTVEKVDVRVYSPAKTVADCFKYRNKIGLDVAIEALRDCWSQKKSTMDELWEAAKVCRMSNVMRPYMESLT